MKSGVGAAAQPLQPPKRLQPACQPPQSGATLSTRVSLVIWKNWPLYVLPSASVASMVPVTAPELFQLKLTGLAPDRVEPVPVPMVVQPAASAISSGNA